MTTQKDLENVAITLEQAASQTKAKGLADMLITLALSVRELRVRLMDNEVKFLELLDSLKQKQLISDEARCKILSELFLKDRC